MLHKWTWFLWCLFHWLPLIVQQSRGKSDRALSSLRSLISPRLQLTGQQQPKECRNSWKLVNYEATVLTCLFQEKHLLKTLLRCQRVTLFANVDIRTGEAGVWTTGLLPGRSARFCSLCVCLFVCLRGASLVCGAQPETLSPVSKIVVTDVSIQSGIRNMQRHSSTFQQERWLDFSAQYIPNWGRLWSSSCPIM